MRRKILIFIVLIANIFITPCALACGEIESLSVDGATVQKIGATSYLVTVKEGTSKVKLDAKTSYEWVDGYGPRTVSTNNDVQLKVNGYRCGYGIYSYDVSFKTLNNLIAENTDGSGQADSQPEATIETGEVDDSNAFGLKNLTITGYEIPFKNDEYTYNLEVEGDVSSLNIVATKYRDTDTVTISENYKNLAVGQNIITITVASAEQGSTTYEIIVDKKEPLSDNNYLANLSIANYQLNFDPSETTYNVDIKREKTLSITAIPESELAETQIIGNDSLSDKGTITVRVSAEDGSTRDYVINYARKFDIMDYWMYLAVGGGIILLVILLVINNKQKKKKASAQTPSEVKQPGNVPSANIATVEPTQEANTEVVAVSPPTAQVDNSSLEIIEPTNLDSPSAPTNSSAEKSEQTPNQQSDDSSATEVFKL